MGNFVTAIVNSSMAEVVKKVKSLGYHTYSFDFENNITIAGIHNNPKCKITARKCAISADELFVLDRVCVDNNGRLCMDIRIPIITLTIGKLAFSCADPKFSCGAVGTIQLVNSHFVGIVSMDMRQNLKFDQITIKPKITEIKSEIKLAVNHNDYSQLGNTMLRSKDPAVLNFLLELIMKNYEKSILEFMNSNMPDMQQPAFD